MTRQDAEATYDIIIRQGATYARTLAWRAADGTLVDTATYTAELKVYQVTDGVIGTVALVDLSTAAGSIVTGIVGDVNVSFEISAAVTAALVDWGLGVYRLNITDGSGRVTRLLQGAAYLSPQGG